jgi:hypothetical protein
MSGVGHGKAHAIQDGRWIVLDCEHFRAESPRPAGPLTLRAISRSADVRSMGGARRITGVVGRQSRGDGWRDIAQGGCGLAVMAAGLLTPFGRGKRGNWGVGARAAARRYPGDELVPQPRWSWTHGIQIEAPPGDVWPWVAQIGADRAASTATSGWRTSSGATCATPKRFIRDGRAIGHARSALWEEPLDDSELAVFHRADRPGPLPHHQPLPLRYLRRPRQPTPVRAGHHRAHRIRDGPAHADRPETARRTRRAQRGPPVTPFRWHPPLAWPRRGTAPPTPRRNWVMP